MYELGKDFRNEGLSHKHNPEFTMVEWYEAYADYEEEAARLEQVVQPPLQRPAMRASSTSHSPWRRIGFVEAIEQQTGIDITAHRTPRELVAAIEAAGLQMPTEGLSWPALADDLLSKFVEPHLIQPTFVMDYPVEISPLAREHRTRPGLVERWEAFAGGMEIANAFSELTDPDVQRERFEAQQRLAGQGEDEVQPYDEVFVAGARAGDAARRRRGPGNRPPGDAPDGPGVDPRGGAVSRHARLTAEPRRPAAAEGIWWIATACQGLVTAGR